MENGNMHRKKPGGKGKGVRNQGSLQNLKELQCLKHVFGNKARIKGENVYSSYLQWKTAYKYTWRSY